jgi:hypothetical protein
MVAVAAGILAMTGRFSMIRRKDWVAFPARFAAVSFSVYGPRAVLSGTPEMVAVPSPLPAK